MLRRFQSLADCRRARRNLRFASPLGLRIRAAEGASNREGDLMNGLIYLIGLIVVIMFILSLLGLR